MILKKEKFNEVLDQYNYDLPEELIAKAPAHPRDAARLLIYDRKTKKTSEAIFGDIGKYLPPKSALVFNETKVIPARLTVKKPTGGLVKILFIEIAGHTIKVLANKPLTARTKLSFGKNHSFFILKRIDKFWLLRPSFPVKDIYKILEKYGEMPIPPYIKNSPLTKSELKKEYQTVFARQAGSVAAPTAALHFTKDLMAKLKKAGHEIIFVTLHVNLGTFAPLTEANLLTGKLHKEYYNILRNTAQKLNKLKKEGRRIIAVGTTSLRALESASRNGKIEKLKGETDIFIRDSYKFQFVDALITNLHVPRSSLIMLVAALIGREKLLELYRLAIRKKFCFFSFGDGMLVI